MLRKSSIPQAGTISQQLPTSVLNFSAKLLHNERLAAVEAADREAAAACERVKSLIALRFPGREEETRQAIRARYEAKIIALPENATLYETWTQLQNIAAFYRQVERRLESNDDRDGYRCGLCHRAECSH